MVGNAGQERISSIISHLLCSIYNKSKKLKKTKVAIDSKWELLFNWGVSNYRGNVKNWKEINLPCTKLNNNEAK